MNKITTEDLIKYYHQGVIKQNDDIALKVIEDFETLIGETIGFFTNDKNFNGTENLCKMISLKYGSVASSPYVADFYSVLLMHHYALKHDIIGAVQKLGNLKDPNQNKGTISVLKTSPVIDDISFNGRDKFSIYSKTFGEYSFYLAREYFKYNEEIVKYMNENRLLNNCHENTDAFQSISKYVFYNFSLQPLLYWGLLPFLFI